MNWPPPRERRAEQVLDGVTWAPDQEYRVVKEGAYLTGWKSSGTSSWGSWRRDLEVGEVIVCAGFGAGFGSDPGFGVEFRDPEVGLTEFHPWVGGAFNYRPEPGYLEPVE
jgi:hypothetical protein